MKKYIVKEIFGPTLQGEATHSGTAVMFLRFSGCNKWTGLEKDRDNAICFFCDTDFANGTPMTVAEIVDELLLKNNEVTDLVISGGEPTLQIDRPLLESLIAAGFSLHLETNGSKDIGDLFDLFTHVTVSPKQSREKTKLKQAHDLKLLYPTQIPGTEPEAWEDFVCATRWLQPVDSPLANQNRQKTIDFVLRNPDWRLSLQTHKLLGVK